MRMTQNKSVDAFGVKGKWLCNAGLILAATLDQTTIKQNPVLDDSQKVTGPGHLAGSTEKLYIQCHITPPDQQARGNVRPILME